MRPTRLRLLGWIGSALLGVGVALYFPHGTALPGSTVGLLAAFATAKLASAIVERNAQQRFEAACREGRVRRARVLFDDWRTMRSSAREPAWERRAWEVREAQLLASEQRWDELAAHLRGLGSAVEHDPVLRALSSTTGSYRG